MSETLELRETTQVVSEDGRSFTTAPETSTTNDATPNDNSVQDSTVPDGGYGWVVILGCSVITWWFVGTTYSWGIIQAALVKNGLSQASTLSFVGSLTVACIAILAILNARLVTMIGARKAGFLGIGLLGLGEILAGFAIHNVGGLFVTVGIVMGVGTSMCFMTVSVVPAQYFLRKRGLANGIVFAGGGLGGATISLVMEKLVDKLGTAWALRIIGILTLATGFPAVWVIKERAPVRRENFIEWSLFTNLRFGLLFVSGAIATFPLFVPPFFLPLFCQSIGMRPAIGAAMVATFNFSSALGRIGCGFLCDYIGPLNVLFLTLVFNGVSMLALWPFSSTLAPLIVFAIWNGIANGGFFAIMPTVVGSVFGSQKVPIAMGMIVTGWAGGYLMGGPIAGYILSAYVGSQDGIAAYRPAMYYAGSMSVGAAILIAVMRLKMDRKILYKL